MNEIFKADSLLYVAFLAIGLVSTVETLNDKLLMIGVTVLILIIRSVMKKYLYKE